MMFNDYLATLRTDLMDQSGLMSAAVVVRLLQDAAAEGALPKFGMSDRDAYVSFAFNLDPAAAPDVIDLLWTLYRHADSRRQADVMRTAVLNQALSLSTLVTMARPDLRSAADFASPLSRIAAIDHLASVLSTLAVVQTTHPNYRSQLKDAADRLVLAHNEFLTPQIDALAAIDAASPPARLN